MRQPGQVLGLEKEKELAARNKKKNYEKILNYGKYVKEMYWPKLSEKSVKDTEMNKQKVLNANRIQKYKDGPKASYLPDSWKTVDNSVNRS